MKYKDIKFDSWQKWFDYILPSVGAFHVIIYSGENITEERYYVDGKLHRVDRLPARISHYHETGIVSALEYCIGYEYYTDGLPSLVLFREDSSVCYEKWETPSGGNIELFHHNPTKIKIGHTVYNLLECLNNIDTILEPRKCSEPMCTEFRNVINFIQSRLTTNN